MKVAIVILCALILLLLTGVLPVGKGLSATAVYTSPVMILLLGLLCVSSIKCCFKRRPVGFILVHLGVVIILAGAFAGYLSGKKGMVQLQLRRPVAESRITTQAGEPVEFGFEVAAKDFEVRFYAPVYHLYRRIPRDQIQPGEMPFEKTAEYDMTGKDFIDVEGFGRIERSSLWNQARGEWTPRRMLDSGAFLHLASQTPSYYGVTIQIVDRQTELDLPVSINHPAGYKGWRFYLTSYDQRNRSYVVLSARRDPGRNTVIAGIWIVIIGTFVLCFRRQAGSLRDVSQASRLPLENGEGLATSDEGRA